MEDEDNGPTFWARIYTVKPREEMVPAGRNQRPALDFLDVPFRLRIPKADKTGRYFVEAEQKTLKLSADASPELIKKLDEALEMMPDSIDITSKHGTLASLENARGKPGPLPETVTWVQYGSASDKYACQIRFVNRKLAKICVFLPNDNRFRSFINKHITACAINKRNVDVPQTIFAKNERDLPPEILRLLDI